MSDKYREFRNYMANELGISRADIEAWTVAAADKEVEKAVKRLLNDNPTLLDRVIDRTARQLLERFSGIRERVAQLVANRVIDFYLEERSKKP